MGWKGGRKRDPNGYWWLYRPDHPHTTKGGYVREHRIVWEETNGRLLRSDEDVHHIDGDRGNNDPSNLVALTKSQHMRLHNQDINKRQRNAELMRTHYANEEKRQQARENMNRIRRSKKAMASE